jgi:hypothetical protein
LIPSQVNQHSPDSQRGLLLSCCLLLLLGLMPAVAAALHCPSAFATQPKVSKSI